MTSAPAGPTPPAQRARAPDLARGAALLGIAVSNSVVHLFGRELGPSNRPVQACPADRAVDVLAAVLADNRGYPLFAFLLGYGTAQLVRRHAAAGVPAARTTSVLVRRAVALVVLGAAHALLLFSGDVLGLYGLLALLLVAAVRAGDRALAAGAAASMLPFTVLGALDALPGATAPSRAEGDFGTAAGLRLLEWVSGLATAPLLGVGVLAPMLLGVLAARRRLLEDPSRHRRLLAVTAAVGLPVGMAGGLPLGLASTGTLTLPPAAALAVGAVHAVSGLAAALAYAAVAALLAGAAAGWLRAVTAPLVACGRRSLSCYLAQSVLLVPVLAPWGLGWGGRLGTAAAAGLAAGAWALTVAWAAALDRLGRRGPAETLLRRLVYGGAQPTDRQGSARSAST